jgi:hypothetical protein
MKTTTSSLVALLASLVALTSAACTADATDTTDTGSDDATENGTTEESSIAASPIPVPAHGAYFGVRGDPSKSRNGGNSPDVDYLEAKSGLGRQMDIRVATFGFIDKFSAGYLKSIHRPGTYFEVTWNPKDPDPKADTSEAILSSKKYDADIHQTAKDIKSLGFPIFLRFGKEMNGSWYEWGTSWDASGKKFKQLWAKVHGIFEQEGVKNVAWVWAPASGPAGQSGNESSDYLAFFPDPRTVDWIALDGYNQNNNGHPARQFEDVVSGWYSTFAHYGKPMMMSEVGCDIMHSGKVAPIDKAAWVTHAAQQMKQHFPLIHAWIHQDYNDGKHDWRFDVPSSAAAAYRAMAHDPYFNP